MTRPEQLTAPCTFHGEGAFWDERVDRLRLFDMLAGAVVTVDPSGATGRKQVSGVVAVVRARPPAGYVLATERGLALRDEDFGVQRSVEAFGTPRARPGTKTAARLESGG